MCCFDFRSNYLVSISFLINIGKEMSLPGFRIYLHKTVDFVTSIVEGLRDLPNPMPILGILK